MRYQDYGKTNLCKGWNVIHTTKQTYRRTTKPCSLINSDLIIDLWSLCKSDSCVTASGKRPPSASIRRCDCSSSNQGPSYRPTTESCSSLYLILILVSLRPGSGKIFIYWRVKCCFERPEHSQKWFCGRRGFRKLLVRSMSSSLPRLTDYTQCFCCKYNSIFSFWDHRAMTISQPDGVFW